MEDMIIMVMALTIITMMEVTVETIITITVIIIIIITRALKTTVQMQTKAMMTIIRGLPALRALIEIKIDV